MLFLVQATRTHETAKGHVVEHLPTFFVEALDAREARLKAERLAGVATLPLVNGHFVVEPCLPEFLRSLEAVQAGLRS